MPTPRRRRNSNPWDIFEDAKRTNRKYTQNVFIGVAILLAALLIFDKIGILKFSDLQNMFGNSSNHLEVHYIDVGQGDCEFVIIGNNAMLIDGGERENGASIRKYMKNNGVKKLDYVIATHPHSDHIGGIPEAIEDIPVDTFILPDIPTRYLPTTRVYENLLEAIEDSGAELEYAEIDKSYRLGGAEFTIIAPATGYSELNDYSVVIWLEYGDNSFLFTGDAEKESEKDILRDYELPNVDVLKCGHHGSNTSSSKEFLSALEPKYAVIECGIDNSYGHPHSEIMERLSIYTDKIYRTDLNGDIVFTSDGKEITVETEK
jgi:competence protein ComEC